MAAYGRFPDDILSRLTTRQILWLGRQAMERQRFAMRLQAVEVARMLFGEK